MLYVTKSASSILQPLNVHNLDVESITNLLHWLTCKGKTACQNLRTRVELYLVECSQLETHQIVFLGLFVTYTHIDKHVPNKAVDLSTHILTGLSACRKLWPFWKLCHTWRALLHKQNKSYTNTSTHTFTTNYITLLYVMAHLRLQDPNKEVELWVINQTNFIDVKFVTQGGP